MTQYTYGYSGLLSAKAGKGVGMLRDLVLTMLPDGPALYPEETVSDQPLETRLAEMIREKALHVTRQELPHLANTQITLEVDHQMLPQVLDQPIHVTEIQHQRIGIKPMTRCSRRESRGKSLPHTHQTALRALSMCPTIVPCPACC